MAIVKLKAPLLRPTIQLTTADHPTAEGANAVAAAVVVAAAAVAGGDGGGDGDVRCCCCSDRQKSLPGGNHLPASEQMPRRLRQPSTVVPPT